MEKKDRFSQAFEYVCTNGYVRTQKELADLMGASPSNISNALRGEPKVLTDRFLVRFARTFPVFNTKWLLTGEGEMLNPSSPTEPRPQPEPVATPADLTTILLKQVADQLAELGEMRRALRETTQRLAEATEELRRSRDDFHRAAARLEIFASHYGSGDIINIAAEPEPEWPAKPPKTK